MSRGLLIALGGGLLGAVLFLTVRTASPGAVIFAFLSPLPLFMVGLSQGWVAATIACGVAALGVMLGGGALALAMFAFRTVAPVLIVVRLGLQSRPGAQPGKMEWYPPGLLLGWLTAYGLLMLAAATGWYLGREGGIEGATRAYFDAAFGAVMAQPDLDPRVHELLGTIPRYLPGSMVAIWLLVTVMNGVLAQGGLVRAGHAVRPAPAWSEIELPRWIAAALALAVVMTLVPGQLGGFGRNAAVVLSMPFFLLGLAVVHAVSRRLAARGFFLGLFYALVVLLVWPALFVVIIGIIEQWTMLRRRFAPPGTGRENE